MIQVKLHRVKNGNRFVWMRRWFYERKRHSETIGSCQSMTKKEAEVERLEKEIALNSGKESPIPPSRTMTFRQFAEDHHRDQVDKSHKTLEAYQDATTEALAAWGKEVRLSSIKFKPHVRLLNEYMRTRPVKGRKHKGLAAASRDKVFRTLKAMLNQAVRAGYLRTNPLAGAGVDWEPKDSRVFSPVERNAMIEVCPDGWWRCFIQLLSTTGLRLNEALHLRWEHVDFQSGTVRVAPQKPGRFTVGKREYPLLAWTAKGRPKQVKAGYRTIPLPDATLGELRQQKARTKSQYVFISLERLAIMDDRMRADNLRPGFEVVNNIGKNHGRVQRLARAYLAEQTKKPLDEIPWRIGTIHDWRDTWCQHMKHHLSPDQLQRAAGHADISTTMKYYTSPSDRDARDIRDGLAKAGLASPAIRGDINSGINPAEKCKDETELALTA